VAILGVDEDAAGAVAASLAEVAPDVRPVLLTASPRETTEARGYAAGADARSYVLGDAEGRGRVRSAAGAVVRATALIGDAGLERLGARPRLTAPSGAAFLEALHGADALLVAGDAAGLGEREALQQRAALLAARTLGLETVVLGRVGADPAAELADVVGRLRGREP
jgi:hypothetical protein